MFDLLFANVRVLDGLGAPAFAGWVGVRGDRIAAVQHDGVPEPEEVVHRIDGAGKALAPGFVDVHNHSDLAPLVEPGSASTIRQGVTTLVVGNCGLSAWPTAGAADCAEMVGGDPRSVEGWTSFGAWIEAMQACSPAVNIAALVGHGAVRQEVMGLPRRAPEPGELRTMRSLVSQAMDEGALGLSTGLIYVPGIFAATDEIVALAEEVAQREGIYASHIRGEGAQLFDAVREAIQVGVRAGLPAHVSHLKCETRHMWGRATDLLQLLRGAEDVTADQYPYTAWESTLNSLLPPWAPVAEAASIAAAERDRLRSAVELGEPDFGSAVDGVGWNGIVVEMSARSEWDGRSVADIAEEAAADPFDMFVQLLVERPETGCIGHAMDEGDVRAILADPDVMIASDAMAMSPDGPLGSQPVHPRNYGTFPRVLGRYVRDGVLPLEAAVRKMTSLPAGRFGLRDRGTIEVGAFADLVMFDPDRVADRAEFGDPHRFPDGIDRVVVNGRVAVGSAAHPERAGRMLVR